MVNRRRLLIQQRRLLYTTLEQVTLTAMYLRLEGHWRGGGHKSAWLAPKRIKAHLVFGLCCYEKCTRIRMQFWNKSSKIFCKQRNPLSLLVLARPRLGLHRDLESWLHHIRCVCSAVKWTIRYKSDRFEATRRAAGLADRTARGHSSIAAVSVSMSLVEIIKDRAANSYWTDLTSIFILPIQCRKPRHADARRSLIVIIYGSGRLYMRSSSSLLF